MSADGSRGRGVAVLLREGIVCLGSVVEDHWVAVAVRDARLGYLVVVAAYLLPSNRGVGAVLYCEYWAGTLEAGRRLQLCCGIAESRLAILGDMNAHLGELQGGQVPEELLQQRRQEGY